MSYVKRSLRQIVKAIVNGYIKYCVFGDKILKYIINYDILLCMEDFQETAKNK